MLVEISFDQVVHLGPDAGHVPRHTQSHRHKVGDYWKAIHTNLKGTPIDKRCYSERRKNLDSFYHVNDYSPLIYGMILAGNFRSTGSIVENHGETWYLR